MGDEAGGVVTGEPRRPLSVLMTVLTRLVVAGPGRTPWRIWLSELPIWLRLSGLRVAVLRLRKLFKRPLGTTPPVDRSVVIALTRVGMSAAGTPVVSAWRYLEETHRDA